MSKQFNLIFAIIFLLILTVPSISLSKSMHQFHMVDIDIVADDGSSFNLYPVNHSRRNKESRAYLEAIKNENYALRIRNNSNQRIGLVVAVDGRNIISGKKSHLKNNERMYILGPHEMQSYAGWRTSSSDIHRFYFTDFEDSYAHSFDDESAMGVIAVAVYQEKQKLKLFQPGINSEAHAPSIVEKSKKRSGRAKEKMEADSAAGTGFGKHEHSLVKRVHFKAQRKAVAKYFYKYEWRETLCHKRVMDCQKRDNRFWPEEFEIGFAPYPPNY